MSHQISSENHITPGSQKSTDKELSRGMRLSRSVFALMLFGASTTLVRRAWHWGFGKKRDSHMQKIKMT